MPASDDKRDLLRHTLATLAYRLTRALGNAPVNFGDYNGAGRRPVEILSHMSDLMDWATSMAIGNPAWKNSPPGSWAVELQRFYAAIATFDNLLASRMPLNAPIDNLMQGPIADALCHTGQLAMLRRMAGSPARGENFYVAAITVGDVGPVQPAPVKPF
jgi:hypothetical protein